MAMTTLRSFALAFLSDEPPVVVDACDRADAALHPLANPWVTVSTMAEMETLQGRRAVVVAANAEDAESNARRLNDAGVAATPLAEGVRGWARALVVTRVDRYADATVAVVVRPARGLISYVIAGTCGTAIINPSGSVDAMLAIAMRMGPIAHGVVDTAFHRDRVSAGVTCAERCECTYYVPSGGRTALGYRSVSRVSGGIKLVGTCLDSDSDGEGITLYGDGFTIGSAATNTYVTRSDDSTWATTFESINRGLSTVDADALERIDVELC